MQIYITGVCFCNFSWFKVLERIPRSTHRRLGYGRLPVPILSCTGDVSMAVDQGWSHFFFIFHSALFGRPLAATIDPQVELMTKMTNPWGARVREIKRKTEGKRPRLYATFPLWGGTFCTLWRDATFMQHEPAIFFFMGVIPELLARPWHGARGFDKWCHHRPCCSATNQTRAVCLSSRRPGTVQRAWSGVGTDHSTNHWSRANCATLRLGLGGEAK